MAQKILAAVFGMIVAASPALATTPEPTPKTIPSTEIPGTQYCLRVGPYTGTRLETVQCLTRQEWSEQCDEWAKQCVDVDQEWAENGVRIETTE